MVAEDVHFSLWGHSFRVATNCNLSRNAMNRAERRRQQKKAEKAAKVAKPGQAASRSEITNPDVLVPRPANSRLDKNKCWDCYKKFGIATKKFEFDRWIDRIDLTSPPGSIP